MWCGVYSLATPGIRYTGPVCIRFAYHVYGESIGALLVYTRFHGSPSNPIFNQTGQLGDRWIEAAVDAVLIYAESVRHSTSFTAFTVAVRIRDYYGRPMY